MDGWMEIQRERRGRGQREGVGERLRERDCLLHRVITKGFLET
jgi:hypothetical protein